MHVPSWRCACRAETPRRRLAPYEHALEMDGDGRWGVPSALDLVEPAPSTVALALSGLGVLTLLLFWTGLPVLLATGGIVLGQTQLDLPADERRVALAAIRVGAAAISLCLLLFVADLL